MMEMGKGKYKQRLKSFCDASYHACEYATR